MAKVFTITDGLENLGAMKTGGQGSVYKGRRIGEIITAIKLLPTPIYSESTDDKNYTDFQNEVQKLKKVNEEPNPHVVTILSSGITDSGNFPFIEMEYIEGPDLEDLLKPPHAPVFTIKETIKVAEQLSNALAHCHKLNVKHGDIKSNNVKFNSHTGNYILLDFGLSVMSDEQRRTSLRHAGAIEFMAPEQNEGQMLFQTDVYSFGIIIFELLAGSVPYPLIDKGETARNQVRLAHMEQLPPELGALRRQKLPAAWSDEKKAREMDIPQWLLNLVARCLKKTPAQRFANGIELHDFILLNSTLSSGPAVEGIGGNLYQQTEALYKEKDELQKQLLELQQRYESRTKEVDSLKEMVLYRDNEIARLQAGGEYESQPVEERKSSTSVVLLLLILLAGVGALAAYTFYFRDRKPQRQESTMPNNIPDRTAETPRQQEFEQEPEPEKQQEIVEDTAKTEVSKPANKPAETVPEPATDTIATATKPVERTTPPPVVEEQTPAVNEGQVTARYKVVSKAYFYDKPSEDTRRNAYIVHWNNAILNGLNEENGFVYVVFTNSLGQTSKGWLRLKDLSRIEE